ncbi:MAG: substrate-binding domain-containing protein [Firmicutes bacterium]|jgi:LacI family transcriptional regulator|nr:substrate-binding domain-containing protein [Bacillota bacterium]
MEAPFAWLNTAYTKLDRASPRPVYLQICDYIHQKILSNELEGRLPSERELAEAFKVERGTIRKALSTLVQEQAVTKFPKIGYFVNTNLPRLHRKPLVGLLVSNIASPHFAALAAEMQRAASRLGVDLVFGNSDRKPANEVEYLRLFHHLEVAGVIMSPCAGESEETERALQELLSANIPVVYVSYYRQTPQLDIVAVDSFRGTKMMVEYLAGIGHRRIGYAGRSSLLAEDPRLRGYLQAVHDLSLDSDPQLIQTGPSFGQEAGYQAMDRLLKLKPRPTAVVAFDDLVALGAMQRLQKGGLRVPMDMTVAGFDNLDLSAHLSPPLTTVDSSVPAMAQTAISLLFKRISGDKTDFPQTVLLEPSLVVRASSMPMVEQRSSSAAL